jgi:DNA polymerase IV
MLVTVNSPRIILHVDMDAFYASVEQRDNPSLRGKPVVVGGSPEERGVVAAASYEARKYGIRSAMPMSRALRLCPEAIRQPPHFTEYRNASDIIRGVFLEYTEIIEPVSLDEAYLDVSKEISVFEESISISNQIKEKINDRTQLVASVGIGPNKFLAKIASDFNKPDGFCIIHPDEAMDFLAPLPVRLIPGVGEKTEQRLQQLRIETISQLRGFTQESLQGALGSKHGERLYQLARGIDHNPVTVDRVRKSLSQEQTFPQDISSMERMETIIQSLADDVSQLLKKRGLKGRNISIKVKFHDFKIATRTTTLDHRTNDVQEISDAALYLLHVLSLNGRRVRLLGVRSAGFEEKVDKIYLNPKDDLQLRFWDE